MVRLITDIEVRAGYEIAMDQVRKAIRKADVDLKLLILQHAQNGEGIHGSKTVEVWKRTFLREMEMKK